MLAQDLMRFGIIYFIFLMGFGQVCWYVGVQYASMKVCRYAGMQVCRYTAYFEDYQMFVQAYYIMFMSHSVSFSC